VEFKISIFSIFYEELLSVPFHCILRKSTYNVIYTFMGMYWLRRGYEGSDKRVEGSHGPA